MKSKYKSSYILLLLTLITLLSGCGETLAVKTQTTPPVPTRTPLPVVQTLQLQISAKPTSVATAKLKPVLKSTHITTPNSSFRSQQPLLFLLRPLPQSIMEDLLPFQREVHCPTIQPAPPVCDNQAGSRVLTMPQPITPMYTYKDID